MNEIKIGKTIVMIIATILVGIFTIMSIQEGNIFLVIYFGFATVISILVIKTLN